MVLTRSQEQPNTLRHGAAVRELELQVVPQVLGMDARCPRNARGRAHSSCGPRFCRLSSHLSYRVSFVSSLDILEDAVNDGGADDFQFTCSIAGSKFSFRSLSWDSQSWCQSTGQIRRSRTPHWNPAISINSPSPTFQRCRTGARFLRLCDSGIMHHFIPLLFDYLADYGRTWQWRTLSPSGRVMSCFGSTRQLRR